MSDLTHTMHCTGNIPMRESACTCGLKWRIMLRTEQEMHNAWRKRAEEAEKALCTPTPSDCREAFEESKATHSLFFPDTTATQYAVYESWFNLGVEAAWSARTGGEKV